MVMNQFVRCPVYVGCTVLKLEFEVQVAAHGDAIRVAKQKLQQRV